MRAIGSRINCPVAVLQRSRARVERLAYAGPALVLGGEQVAELSAELAGRVYLTAKAVCGFVSERFGLAYTPHAMARLLGRLGFVWKRPKVVPAQADAATQRAFLDGTLLPLMAAAEADPASPLLFVDATHPAYGAHPAAGWIRRGETATLPSNHGRVNVTLNGALSWPGRAVITLEAPLITGAEMVAFFAQIAERDPLARTITLVRDNAACNRASGSASRAAGSASYLPPSAPNLSLIERLWWFFKKALWNTHYPTLADFRQGIRTFFYQRTGLLTGPRPLRAPIEDAGISNGVPTAARHQCGVTPKACSSHDAKGRRAGRTPSHDGGPPGA
jgi:hypothetical protein